MIDLPAWAWAGVGTLAWAASAVAAYALGIKHGVTFGNQGANLLREAFEEGRAEAQGPSEGPPSDASEPEYHHLAQALDRLRHAHEDPPRALALVAEAAARRDPLTLGGLAHEIRDAADHLREHGALEGDPMWEPLHHARMEADGQARADPEDLRDLADAVEHLRHTCEQAGGWPDAGAVIEGHLRHLALEDTHGVTVTDLAQEVREAAKEVGET